MGAFSFGLIYKITCLVNGKMYIGQTIQPVEMRWAAHKNSSPKPTYLQKAIKKHGLENFKFEVLCQANSRESLNYLEDYFIAHFDCLAPKGYTCVGSRGKDSLVSVETRKRMSLARMGKPAFNKGKKMSAESRAKMSAAKKGKRPSNCGKPFSEETKAKMSAARKGKCFMSPKQYAAIGEKQKGKTCSQETKARMSKSAIGRKLDEDTKKKISQKKIRYRYFRNPVNNDLKTSDAEASNSSNLEYGAVQYNSPQEVRNAGFDYATVVAVCNGTRKQHKGFRWKKVRIS